MQVAKNGRTVLLGEDDLDVRSYLETALKCQGYAVELAQDGEEVLACLAGDVPISAVVLDLIMPRRDGLDTLKEIRRLRRDLPVIMISGSSSPLSAVEAMKNGANDFLCKPINPEDLRRTLRAAFEGKPAAPLSGEPSNDSGHGDASGYGAGTRQLFFGTSRSMQELQAIVAQVASCEAPVLIQGETGCGKEVLARELHALSPRAKRPILKLNCAALPSELVESELFGYERGAFTGAFQRKPGMFEQADGGTILLDEIGDMDFKLQAKLLQVLQDQEFQRLGGKEVIRVDVRVIAATHRDLEQAIADNCFREDLYYRLNVINLRLPPLRERKEDILPLTEFLFRKHTGPGVAPPEIPAALLDVLLEYHWPGNIRELENVVRKFLVLRDTDLIRRGLRSADAHNIAPEPITAAPVLIMTPAPELPPIARPVDCAPFDESESVLEQAARAKREAERSVILATLEATNWNRRQAAIRLRIDYKALLYKMKKLSIRKEKRVLAMAAGAPRPAPDMAD